MINDRIYDEAAGWLMRQYDDTMDWDGFTHWLEANPDHRLAFDELASVDARLNRHSQRIFAAEPAIATVERSHRVRWRPWAGFGGAAIAAGLTIMVTLQSTSRTIAMEVHRSAPGKTVVVALHKGGEVILAPASQLTIKGENLALRGTAYFDIPHKPGRTLTVSAGDFKVVDIGTRFAVANETDGLDVAVAQGSLSIASARLMKPISLTMGQELRADRSGGTIHVLTVDPQDIATWRAGRLQFDQAPLALVARDVSRYSGERITVDPAVAGQPFSGVIAIGHGEAPARTLAEILSLRATKANGGVRLEPRRR